MSYGPMTCINTHYSGKDNYAADRAATEAWVEVDPDIAFTVRANRAFLGRVVRYLAEIGRAHI